MNEVEAKEMSVKEYLRKLFPRIVRAIVLTAILGACLLVFWYGVLEVFAWYPEYKVKFAVLAWALVFFTFAITVASDTIYEHIFIVGRALFLIVYLIYATNGGTLALDFMSFHFTLEFIPLLALMILINFLDIARGILQAIELASENPLE